MENTIQLLSLSEMPIEALLNFHKQEGQESLAYITILFTIILGIIGYLGTAQKVQQSARILILVFYSCMHIVIIYSFFGSMEMHGAIHEELSLYAKEHPDLFIEGEDSSLYDKLISLEGNHPIKLMRGAGIGLLAFVMICILSLGDRPILNWDWVDRRFR